MHTSLIVAAAALTLCQAPTRNAVRFAVAERINRRTGWQTPEPLRPRFVVKVRDVATGETRDIILKTKSFATRSVFDAAPALKDHHLVEVIDITPISV